jgi:FkbM family methyltransferase
MNLAGRLALALLRAYARIAPTQKGGYRLARLVRRFVAKDHWHGPFTLGDQTRLTLDLATYPDCCMAVGLYELDTARLLRRLLNPGDHFVDCGANLGYFTLLAARCVGPTGRVDAFEPDPQNRARLEAHLAANETPAQVKVHPVALADGAGEATLYHPTAANQNHGESSLYAPADLATHQPCTVRTARLDALLSALPHLIKMDIEGAELSAIKGMTALLTTSNPPKLIIEHNPESAAAAGHRPGDLLRQLRQSNPAYSAQWIGPRRKRLTSEAIDAIQEQGNILYRAN